MFEDLKNYLEVIGDTCAGSHAYGQGPNFKLRVVKKAFASLGMNPDLARHGLPREVFFSHLATNALQVLRGEHTQACYKWLPTVENRGNAALTRWVIPRSVRMPGFRKWQQENFLHEIATENKSCATWYPNMAS